MHEAVVCLVVLGLIQPHSLASSVPGFRICELPDLPLPEKKDTTLAGLRGEWKRATMQVLHQYNVAVVQVSHHRKMHEKMCNSDSLCSQKNAIMGSVPVKLVQV